MFGFETTNTLVVSVEEPSKPVTLASLIKSYKAEKLFAHAPFPKGSPPPKVTRKKDFAFTPAADESGAEARALAAVASATKTRAMWMVGAEGSKIVPKGLVLASTCGIPAAPGDVEL